MKAIVVGATGLVGTNIVEELLQEPTITEVVVFVRRSSKMTHPKLRVVLTEFDQDSWLSELKGDILFSALGTTLKAAGSKEAQWLVDYEYQLKAAKAAAINKVNSMVLISSDKANSSSPFFYFRMKGELEERIKELSFQSLSFLRPGPLKGARDVKRIGELFATKVLDALPFVPLSLRPIGGKEVAKVAVKVGLEKRTGLRIIEASELYKLAARPQRNVVSRS